MGTQIKDRDIVVRLRDDVVEFMENYDELITDERDLQVQLTVFLKMRYEKVHTEYRIPRKVLRDDKVGIFPWNNNISVDIVVEADKNFACLELKYATRAIVYEDRIFGESIKDIIKDQENLNKINIIKDQGAVDIVMYNYWKDVRRIEALKSSFPNVKGGVALIVTNNHLFWDEVQGSPAYINFSTSEGRTVEGALDWNDGFALGASFPGFCLDESYICNWNPTKIEYVTKVKDKKTKTPYKFMFMALAIM